MAFKFLTGASLTIALLVTTACTANVSATLPGNTSTGGGGGETAKAAVQASTTAPEAQQLNLGDLTPYRLETTDADTASRTWVIYYYSPSAKKSYRCTQRIGQKVDFVEVTDASLVYTPGDDIDQAKWKVDSEQAKTVAVQAFQQVNTTVNITTLNVTNMVLLSAKEFTRRTGKPSDDPVWMCSVKPADTSASASPSPTPSPSAVPSTAPSPAPSASASPTSGTTVNNITNVYINANTGNQIAVNTGTQTDTTTTQTSSGNATATTGSSTSTTTTP